jgi:predicted S18 family serine protease
MKPRLNKRLIEQTALNLIFCIQKEGAARSLLARKLKETGQQAQNFVNAYRYAQELKQAAQDGKKTDLKQYGKRGEEITKALHDYVSAGRQINIF